MANKHLATYLNDHLAGSVMGLELLTHLEATQGDIDLTGFVATLHADFVADRSELEALMARLQITKSAPRQATAWLAEKMTQLKLHLDDPTAGALRLLEALETLSIGILGKRALWRALAVADEPGLQGVDYEHWAQFAEDQHRRVEAMRLEAAKKAFAA